MWVEIEHVDAEPQHASQNGRGPAMARTILLWPGILVVWLLRPRVRESVMLARNGGGAFRCVWLHLAWLSRRGQGLGLVKSVD